MKKHPGVYNTRTGLGGFADRVGALAYALTPFTVLLSTRESLLSLITGVPYQHFGFLHRWTGRIIFIQSFLHTLGWTIIEGNLYRPQPSVYKAFIQEQYILFGVVAQIFITFLYIFSTSWAIRWTGYEFFKRTHWVIAILYLGACWGHWDGLACWMIASLILVFLDKGVRILRTSLLHIGYRKGLSGLGFQAANATLQHFGNDNNAEDGDGEVLRIDFDFAQTAWKPGQHFYLCFPALSLWQSHPFTPSSLPDGKSGIQHHTYLVRVRKGITAQLSTLVKTAATESGTATTSVIICGPYGGSNTETNSVNILSVAGGTGVTSVLPIVQDALTVAHPVSRAMDFVWIVRYVRDLDWISPELLELKDMLKKGGATGLRLRIFVTRESGPATSSSASVSSCEVVGEKDKGRKRQGVAAKSCCGGKGEKEDGVSVTDTGDLLTPMHGFEVVYLDHAHPSINDIVDEFASRAQIAGGRNQVVGAGPMEIGTLLRAAIAKKNEAGKVWQGDESGVMGLDWDCHS